jgi:hypothetical protein
MDEALYGKLLADDEAVRFGGRAYIADGVEWMVCIRRRPPDCRMRANTASSMMALREGQAAC